jgi:hypothetical protein
MRAARNRVSTAVVVAIVAACAISACGGDDDSSAASSKRTTTTSRVTTTTGAPTTTGGSATTGGAATTAPPPPPTTAAPAGPVITSFAASASVVACPATDVSTTVGPPTVTLSWTTQNATGVDLAVDGPGLYASYGPNGNTLITVPCDGGTHTYMLTAKGAGGATAQRTVSVETRT